MASKKPTTPPADPEARAFPPAPTPEKAGKDTPLTDEIVGSVLSTVSAPSTARIATGGPYLNSKAKGSLAQQKVVAQELSSAVPVNPLKAKDRGLEHGHHPQAGQPQTPSDLIGVVSTVQEMPGTPKTGSGATLGTNATIGTLDKVRVDAGGQTLTTNMGMAISDNQNSLKAGLRGPTLLEDFILREKITHFDHERIPERIVHARGSAAHGVFECYEPLTRLTKASVFASAGKLTPVFVRFSTVLGERGASDLTRDVRGFAVKFYTDAGNWDIVGNNMPVFFIQDAMKFPDLIHAGKPEPHNQMPQGATAHDTFWDFASLSPETTHMLVWVMSDRALPRSFRTMQGFGVHSFRFVNEQGESVFVKFHWNPVAGTQSVVWDEAVKISGADPDFHRRDLWESIEAGNFPAWELGVQTFTEAQAAEWNFDILDSTKLVPEELVPVVAIGKMTLTRNPDNYFAETEQVAFSTANVIPGIDFSNDPLLHGRHHSYLDTQLTRLGGPNFHELPINSPLAPVFNNQRDGIHRQAIPRGRVAYEPNSLAGGCPFQAGMKGFVSFPEPVAEDKVRGKPEKFADHYSQATLFWKSQTPVEQNHIVGAFRFELSRVQVQAIRERVLSQLANVASELAARVAEGLGVPVPPAMPTVLGTLPKSAVAVSPKLSLTARPGDGGVAGRKVALLVCDGVDDVALRTVYQALADAGAAPRFVGARLGVVTPASGKAIHVEISAEAAPSVLWDAVVVPGAASAQQSLAKLGMVKEFLRDQYRHCKPILDLGEEPSLLRAAGIPLALDDGRPDLGLVLASDQPSAKGKKGQAGPTETLAASFIAALGKHRHYERDRDPPAV